MDKMFLIEGYYLHTSTWTIRDDETHRKCDPDLSLLIIDIVINQKYFIPGSQSKPFLLGKLLSIKRNILISGIME